VDIIKLEKFTACLRPLLKIESPFDYVMKFLDDLQNVYECPKATFFLLHQRIHDEFFEDFTNPASKHPQREKYKQYIHGLMFDDT
jgi:hypothetical protein